MKPTRVLIAALLRFACLATLILSGPAAADDLASSRYELSETRHTIDVRLDRGHALLRIRRTLANPGPKSDQALLRMDLPEGAVATALRTRGGDRWFEGEILEAELAAARYRELTGIGGATPKDPALLSWIDQQELLLQVFPVPARGTSTFEVELSIPLYYEAGRYTLELPSELLAEKSAVVTVHAATPSDRLFLEDEPYSPGDRVILSDGGEGLVLALEPRDVPRLSGELAVANTKHGRFVTHLELGAAPRLSRVPRGAYVVVLIDLSRSRSDEEVEAEIAVASTFLTFFPEVHAQVIAFDRKLHPITRGFVELARAEEALARFEPRRRNGSHLDLALARADALLAQAPAYHARRVLLLTDLLTRKAVTPASMSPLLSRSGALLHMVRVGAYDLDLRRDDDDPWSPGVSATGGLLWDASAWPRQEEDEDDSAREQRHAAEEAMSAVFEELARPIALDHFELHAPGMDSDQDLGLDIELETEGRLGEGEGIDLLELTDRAVPYLSASGLLWNEPIVRMIRPDEAAADRWSALVFGSDLLDELDEDEMMVLALRGGAVSPVTSFLAIEPGVRPSTEGLDWGMDNMGTMGFGVGGSGGIGCGGAYGTSSFDPKAWLLERATKAWAQCGGTGRASLSLETTLDEIVELKVKGASSSEESAKNTARACLAEAIWAIELSPRFRAQHRAFSLSFVNAPEQSTRIPRARPGAKD